MKQISRPRALFALPLFASLQIAAGASSPAWSQSSPASLAQRSVAAAKPASPQQPPATQQGSTAGCPIVHEQLPDFFAATFSDSAEPQVVADNLILAADTEVCQLSILGVFAFGSQISPGSFDLIVHEDAGGFPGPVVYSESGITPSFTLTGDVLNFPVGTFDVYRVDIIPAGPILLVAGVTYWFEIFYNSDPNDEPWAWATASPDPDSGLAGSALASEAPGVNWTNETQDLAIEVFGVESLDGIGTPICAPANTNSTGGSGTLLANGSDLAADNNLTFTAAGLPLGQVGYLVNSMNTQMLPISDGLLCIGPGFGRHVTKAGNSDMFGEISTTVDLTSLPRSSGPEPVLAGQTWYFQFWHRDGNASNFTNALEILFQ